MVEILEMTVKQIIPSLPILLQQKHCMPKIVHAR